MKNKCRIVIVLLLITTLTGCSKYKKDESYDTDLYGTYVQKLGTDDASYVLNISYELNNNNTYNYIYNEINNGETINDANKSGKILSIEEISDNITQITLDREITEWSTGETSNEVIYKYKNMLGSFLETDVPTGKTFELVIPTPSENWTGSFPNAANVFDKNGYYHSCLDVAECNDTVEEHKGVFYEYVRKNNIIYFIDPSAENMNYQILYYIVDDGVFAPEYYKE